MNTETAAPKYRVTSNGVDVGELTPDEMSEYLRQGMIDAAAVYWNKATQRWKPVKEIADSHRSVRQLEKLHAVVAEKRSDRKRSTFQLLAFVVGGLGLHNIYARRYVFTIFNLIITGFAILDRSFVWISLAWVVVELFAVRKDGAGDLLA